jgi:hypothetical protein
MSRLHLNIFPIQVPETDLTVGVIPFSSRDALRDLRDGNRGTHVFKRVRVEGADLIYSIPLDGGKCSIASQHENIKLHDNLGVARSLLNESFIASFSRTAHRPIIDVDPLKVVSSEAEHDYLAQAADGLVDGTVGAQY